MHYKKTDDGRDEEALAEASSGTIADYFRMVDAYRALYPEAFARIPTTEEFIQSRRQMAALE